MKSNNLFRFECKLGDGSVDPKNCVITGVSMITSGVEAKGHDLEVDDTTLTQLLQCAVTMGQVPVKTNHGTGADAVNGFLTNFRQDGPQLRADWHLLKSYPNTAHILEMAERMPANVGLSVAFRGDPEKKAGGKKAARCVELVSTDLVATPAANPNGLFSAGGVDKGRGGKPMPDENTPNNPGSTQGADEAPAWAKQLLDQVGSLSERLDAMEAGDGDEDGIELTEEQIEEGLADGSLEQDEHGNILIVDASKYGEGADEGEEVEREGVDVNDEKAVETAGTAALARGDRITYLEAQVRLGQLRFEKLQKSLANQAAGKRRQAEHTLFSAIETKTETLLNRLNELQAENESLSELVDEYQNGGGSMRPASDGGESFMFDRGQAEAPEGATQFEAAVNKRFHELSQKGGMTTLAAKGEALKQVMKERPAVYRQHLKEKGLTR